MLGTMEQVILLFSQVKTDLEKLKETTDNEELKKAFRNMERFGLEPAQLLENLTELQKFITGMNEKGLLYQNEHFLIYSPYSNGTPVGCCTDKEDVLSEEPNYTFTPVTPEQCPICCKE